MTSMRATDIGTLCDGRGWSRARLVHELNRAASARGQRLPGDKSLQRMIRQWNAGDRLPSTFYAELLSAVFGLPISPDRDDGEKETTSDTTSALAERLRSSATVDIELINLLEDQTESYRNLDRRLGAKRIFSQAESHTKNIQELFSHSIPGEQRTALGAAAAEAAALAGWQALDLGDLDSAWRLHEAAKTAARESGNQSILAHVTAQQGYILLDANRNDDAITLMQSAKSTAQGKVSPLIWSWLCAAEAESLAASGQDAATRKSLDMAAASLNNDDGEKLPFVFLDEVHLSRWRGHCLARLGAVEAVEDLANALDHLDPTFTRAAAGLHCDLALALSV
ncbi:hypothetical protein, partial [Candidatus Frankia nodulisporulans]